MDNEAQQGQQPKEDEVVQSHIHPDVLKLISVPSLSHQAAIMGIVAFEAEAAQRGVFPFKFAPSNGVVCKFNKEIPFKFVCLSDISQYTRYSLSLFVEFADLNADPDTWKYHVFRQASYSNPTHAHIGIDNFLEEKNAIKELLKAEMKAEGKPNAIVCRFFNLYYLSDEMIKQTLDRGGKFSIVDLTSNDKEATAVDEVIAHGDDLITGSDVLIADEHADPWTTIPESTEKKD